MNRSSGVGIIYLELLFYQPVKIAVPATFSKQAKGETAVKTIINEEDIPQEPTQEMAIAAKEEILGEEKEAKEQAGSTIMTASSSRTQVRGNILAKHKDTSTYYLIGGKGGRSFEDAKYYQGIVVSGIEAWAGGWQLRGIRIKFSDGSVITRGKCEGTHRGGISIDYLSGETVTELSIWGNGAGTRCGAFRIKTSKGQVFFPKMTKWGLKTEYKMNSGGGVILGVIGGDGSDIDRLGFLMLDKVKTSVLVQFEYDLNKVSLPEKKYAYDITIPNPSKTDSDNGTVTRKVAREKGGEWFIKAGLKFGQEYKVQGGVPFVAGGEATTKWEVSVEGGYTSKWSDNDEETVTIPLIAPALTKTRIVYSYFQGKLDGCPFAATMKYYLMGGGIWDCAVTGFYDGVDTTRVVGTSYLIARWNEEKGKWIDEDKPQMRILYGR